MGVALSPCIVPRVGHPSFELAEDELEIGMGIHGEPGTRRGKMISADEIVVEMMSNILPDLPYTQGDEVAVLVNGLGGTPLEEQYVVYRQIDKILKEKGIQIFQTFLVSERQTERKKARRVKIMTYAIILIYFVVQVSIVLSLIHPSHFL